MKVLSFEGLSPLLFGTGRPFGDELGSLNAATMELPLPSTFAGAIRNHLARDAGWTQYKDEYRDRLLAVRCRGPILTVDRTTYFSRPANAGSAQIKGAAKQLSVPALPSRVLGGCDLPEGLLPCMVNLRLDHEPSKQDRGRFWPLDRTVDWLLNRSSDPIDEVASFNLKRETRTHVKLAAGGRTAEKGMLFQTEGLCLGDCLEFSPDDEGWGMDRAKVQKSAFLAAFETDDPDLACGDMFVSSLGGERRLAIGISQEDSALRCPDGVREALAGSKQVRLTLATPGLFEGGWKPGWSEWAGVKLKLVSACVARPEVYTGWDMHGGEGNRGQPKPVRWAAPAGSTYFFEVEDGDAASLAQEWLAPVSDRERDRNDGFGLALWGIWDYLESER